MSRTAEEFANSLKVDSKTMERLSQASKNSKSSGNMKSHWVNKTGKESFAESLRVDNATIAKTNQLGRQSAKSSIKGKSSSSSDSGGREIGDDGPGSHGRESGYKTGAVKSNARTSSVGRTNTSASHNGSNGHGLGNHGGKNGGTGGHGGH